MTYVVTEACMDVLDRSCLEDCPVEAAMPARILLGTLGEWNVADNAEFFTHPLPGRSAALGTPRGASPPGPIGVDTQAVTVLADCGEPQPGTTHLSGGGAQQC